MIYRRSMTEHVSGDDARLPQRRHLVTEIPGPVSRELLTRRERAVARGVSHVLPVFRPGRGGGRIGGPGGHPPNRLGVGDRGGPGGNRAPAGAGGGGGAGGGFPPSLLYVAAFGGYVEV